MLAQNLSLVSSFETKNLLNILREFSEKQNYTEEDIQAITQLIHTVKHDEHRTKILARLVTVVSFAEIKQKDNQIKMLQLLLEAIPSTLTPLHTAIMHRNLDLSLFLIEEPGYKYLIHKVDGSRITPLHLAIIKLLQLVSKHHLSRKQVSERQSIFEIIISTLLKKGACWDAVNAQYETPLYLVVKSNRLDILKFILKQLFASDKVKAAYTLLKEIFLKKEAPLEFIDYLLEQIPLPEINKTKKGFSFLHAAIESKLPIVVIEKLLTKGADPKLSVKHRNALDIAIEQEQVKTIQLFLKSNDTALLDAQDSKGNTPFHYIAESFQLDVVKEFLGYGTNILQRNKKGETPIYKAICNRDPAIFIHLIDTKDFNLNQVDNKGNTYLHLAAQQKKSEVIQRLLCAGAQWNIKNIYNKIPLEIAIQNSSAMTPTLADNSLRTLRSFIQYSPGLEERFTSPTLNRAPKRVKESIAEQVQQNKKESKQIAPIFQYKKDEKILYAPAREIYYARKTELRTLTTMIAKPLPIELCSMIGVYLTQEFFPHTYSNDMNHALITGLLTVLSANFAKAESDSDTLECAKRKYEENNVDELTTNGQSNTVKRLRIS